MLVYWSPRNHPKLLSQKPWHLLIRNGPIARGFWNLNQSIEQKVKNLQLEKSIYIKDITITFWDTAQYFHSKQLRKSFGYKRPKSFFQIHIVIFSFIFTKFTGPAKLFPKNNIFFFSKKKLWILGFFLVMKPAERSAK